MRPTNGTVDYSDRLHVTAQLSKAAEEVRRSTRRALPTEDRRSIKPTPFP